MVSHRVQLFKLDSRNKLGAAWSLYREKKQKGPQSTKTGIFTVQFYWIILTSGVCHYVNFFAERWPGSSTSISIQPSHGDEVHHQHEQPQWYDVTKSADHHQPIPAQHTANLKHGRTQHHPHFPLTSCQQVCNTFTLQLHQWGWAGWSQQGEQTFNDLDYCIKR